MNQLREVCRCRPNRNDWCSVRVISDIWKSKRWFPSLVSPVSLWCGAFSELEVSCPKLGYWSFHAVPFWCDDEQRCFLNRCGRIPRSSNRAVHLLSEEPTRPARRRREKGQAAARSPTPQNQLGRRTLTLPLRGLCFTLLPVFGEARSFGFALLPLLATSSPS